MLKVESGNMAHLSLHGHHVLRDWVHLEALFIVTLCWLLAGQFYIFQCNFSENFTLTQGENLLSSSFTFLVRFSSVYNSLKI